MRNTLILIFLFGLFSSNFCQQTPEKRNVLCASINEDPLLIIWKIHGITNGISYERSLKGNQSLGLGLSYTTSLKPTNDNELFSIDRINKAMGFKGQVSMKQYLKCKKLYWPLIIAYPFHALQFKNVESEHTGYYISESVFGTSLNMERRQFDPVYAGTQTYTTTRNAMGAGFHAGFMCEKKFGLIIDCSIGIGLQYAWSYSQGKVVNPNNYPVLDMEPFLMSSDVDKLGVLLPYFSSTFKIGWKF